MRGNVANPAGVYFFFPETNGRHLEEVDEIFLQSKSIFDTVSVARHLPRATGHFGQTLEEKVHHSGDATSADQTTVSAEHRE